MNKVHLKVIEALAQVMPEMTHKTTKPWLGQGIKDRWPELKDVDGNEIDVKKKYNVLVEEPIKNDNLLKAVYQKTQGDKIAGCIKAVKTAIASKGTDKIQVKTADGLGIISIELAPETEQPKVVKDKVIPALSHAKHLTDLAQEK